MLMRDHPDYTAAYLHAGNVAMALGARDDAEAIYRRGIEACVRRGDTHARGKANYETVSALAGRLVDDPAGPARLAALRKAALADETGGKLRDTIGRLGLG